MEQYNSSSLALHQNAIRDDSKINTRIVQRKNTARHIHANFYEIIYVLEGQIQHFFDGQSVMLCAGDCVILPVGSFHAMQGSPDSVKPRYYGVGRSV